MSACIFECLTLNVINQSINHACNYVCVASISLEDMLSWLYQSNIIVLYTCNYVPTSICNYVCVNEHGVKLLPWVPTDGEVFPTDASPCS
jgi:hypothetical protein